MRVTEDTDGEWVVIGRDVDAAERAVLALGAVRLPSEHENGFRVFADPAGHPFCLVHG